MEQQCIFCSLIEGKIPSKKIYEDETVFAILDIYPANPAHILVLPKEHAIIINQLPQKTVEHLGFIAKKLSEVVLKALQPDGVNIFIANGPAAGQKAPHFIMHVIPRYQGDGLSFGTPENDIKPADSDAFYTQLKNMLPNYFPDQKYDETNDKNEQMKNEIKEEKRELKEEKRETKQETQKENEKIHDKKMIDEKVINEKMIKEKNDVEDSQEKKIVKAEPIDLDKLAEMFIGKKE